MIAQGKATLYSAVRNAVPLLSLMTLAVVWPLYSPLNLPQQHPQLLFLTVGLLLANLVGRIVVARVCMLNVDVFYYIMVPFTAVTVNSVFFQGYVACTAHDRPLTDARTARCSTSTTSCSATARSLSSPTCTSRSTSSTRCARTSRSAACTFPIPIKRLKCTKEEALHTLQIIQMFIISQLFTIRHVFTSPLPLFGAVF